MAQGIGLDGSGSVDLEIAGGKYSTVRMLFKIGAFGAVGSLTGGITLTTPSPHITGTGQLGFNQSVFGPDTAALAATIQTDLPAEYKSPWSIGAGAAWRFGGTRIQASTEWFDEIPSYVVAPAQACREYG